ncbi:MAG: hypothetical protein ACTSRJ_01435, partial [Candidatus Hodarchaeales archaeon]
SRVIAVSETRDEVVKFFSQFKTKLDSKDQFPGAICVQVGNENKFYRIPIDQEENNSHQTMEKPSKNLERVLYQ